MNTSSLQSLQHEHVFLGDNHERNERRTWFVIALTATMMVVEIVVRGAYKAAHAPFVIGSGRP